MNQSFEENYLSETDEILDWKTVLAIDRINMFFFNDKSL